MIEHTITPPVGLRRIVDRVTGICTNPAFYRLTDTVPGHFIVNLNPGEGRSCLCEWIAAMYQEYKIMKFSSRRKYVEFTLDGTRDNATRTIDCIKACAEYDNEYAGIVALDISALASANGQPFVKEFCENIANIIGSHSTLIFFVPSTADADTVSLINCLRSCIKGTEMLTIPHYTTEELASIALKKLEEAGINIAAGKENTSAYIADIIRGENCQSISSLMPVLKTLFNKVDFTGRVPVLKINKNSEVVYHDK